MFYKIFFTLWMIGAIVTEIVMEKYDRQYPRSPSNFLAMMIFWPVFSIALIHDKIEEVIS